MSPTERFRAALSTFTQSNTFDTRTSLFAAARNEQGHEVPAIVITDNQIDIDKSVEAFEWFCETGYKRPGAVLPSEYAGQQDKRIEASPKTGEPLFRGRDPQGNDWSDISQDDREVVSYGAVRGELHALSSEAIVFALKNSPQSPPWPRLRLEWHDLCNKTNKSAEDERFILSVKQRLLFRKSAPTYIPPAPKTPPELRDPVTRPGLRQALRNYCVTSSDLMSFLLDYFPAIHRRVTSGMDRIAIENMLLESCAPELTSRLRQLGWV